MREVGLIDVRLGLHDMRVDAGDALKLGDDMIALGVPFRLHCGEVGVHEDLQGRYEAGDLLLADLCRSADALAVGRRIHIGGLHEVCPAAQYARRLRTENALSATEAHHVGPHVDEPGQILRGRQHGGGVHDYGHIPLVRDFDDLRQR